MSKLTPIRLSAPFWTALCGIFPSIVVQLPTRRAHRTGWDDVRLARDTTEGEAVLAIVTKAAGVERRAEAATDQTPHEKSRSVSALLEGPPSPVQEDSRESQEKHLDWLAALVTYLPDKGQQPG